MVGGWGSTHLKSISLVKLDFHFPKGLQVKTETPIWNQHLVLYRSQELLFWNKNLFNPARKLRTTIEISWFSKSGQFTKTISLTTGCAERSSLAEHFESSDHIHRCSGTHPHAILRQTQSLGNRACPPCHPHHPSTWSMHCLQNQLFHCFYSLTTILQTVSAVAITLILDNGDASHHCLVEISSHELLLHTTYPQLASKWRFTLGSSNISKKL